MAVLLFHLETVIWRDPQLYGHGLSPLFRTGVSGVDFFFVLSGFLMTWLHGDQIGDPAAARRFLWKRAVRIYPMYWVALALAWLASPHEIGGLALLANLALLPAQGAEILGVSWTLHFELLFYLIFAGLLAFPRLFRPLIVLWGAAALARGWMGPLPFALSFLTSPWILLFLYGMAAAWAARRGAGRPLVWIAVGALLMLAMWAGDYAGVTPMLTRHGKGLASGMIIVGLVAAETSGRLGIPNWLIYGGDISYALYLTHLTVLTLGASALFGTVPEPVVALVLVLGCIAVAAALHEVVEKRLVRRWRAGSGTSSAVAVDGRARSQ